MTTETSAPAKRLTTADAIAGILSILARLNGLFGDPSKLLRKPRMRNVNRDVTYPDRTNEAARLWQGHLYTIERWVGLLIRFGKSIEEPGLPTASAARGSAVQLSQLLQRAMGGMENRIPADAESDAKQLVSLIDGQITIERDRRRQSVKRPKGKKFTDAERAKLEKRARQFLRMNRKATREKVAHHLDISESAVSGLAAWQPHNRNAPRGGGKPLGKRKIGLAIAEEQGADAREDEHDEQINEIVEKIDRDLEAKRLAEIAGAIADQEADGLAEPFYEKRQRVDR